MRRSRLAGALTSLLLTATLSGPVLGQGQPSRPLAGATQAAATNDERRARIWGATARFIYADDPDLASLRAELEPAMDEGSLSTFASSLNDAVNTEKQQRPSGSHLQTFQSFFEANRSTKDLPVLLTVIRRKLESNDARMRDPARKQQLDALTKQLNQLAISSPLPAAPGAGPAAPVLARPAVGAGLPASAPMAGTVDTTPPPGSNLPAPLPPLPAAPEAASSSLPMFSLILSALSLLGVVYLLNRGRPRRSSSLSRTMAASAGQSSAGLGFSSQQYEELRREVQKQVAAALAGNRPAASQPLAQPRPEPRLATASAPGSVVPAAPVTAAVAAAAAIPTPPPAPNLESITAEPAAASPPTIAPPPAPQLRTIYVNQQPLDGAFRRDNLADAPASYTIFEITVDAQTPDQGTFAVTRNEAAHGGYIGSHHSILEPACTYSYPQGAVSRIITDVPGAVQRLASGDWHISRKAQIHFA